MKQYEVLLNKPVHYGSPGYPMIFIPRKIEQVGKSLIEITGDIPSCEDPNDHFFQISETNLGKFLISGEIFWIDSSGGHNYMKRLV